jgi:hypothetical protein
MRDLVAQVARLEHGRPFHRAAPRERAQPCAQLRERERLGQIVVGAAIEAADPILHSDAGGQHQHRCPDARGPQPATDLESV